MTEQIFISHSSRDKKLINWFIDRFADTGVKPVHMEYETWSRNKKPNWLWIKSEIEKSKALVVVLTRNIVKKEHTQNWVAFEVGVAAANKPEVPVMVFREEGEVVDFPVPYFNQYYLIPIIQRGKWKVMNAYFAINDIIQGIRQKPNVSCSKCFLEYLYWPAVGEFKCPCCNNLISVPYDEGY